MALPEEATVYLRIWTRQPCVACGAVFHYVRRFTVQRRDMMFNATVESVSAEYRQHAAQFSEACPCPQCGYVQPDMIGLARSARHFTVNFAGLAFLLAAIIATGIGVMPRFIGCTVSGGIPLLALLLQLLIAMRNPNRNLKANQGNAGNRRAADSTRVEDAGRAYTNPLIGVSSLSLAAASGLYLLSAACLFLPALGSWPVWIGQIPGLALFLFAGSRFANLAYALSERALPHQILEVDAIVITDDSVPPDFASQPASVV